MWGWEPTQITEYEYDDDGRLLRSITTREAEFNEEQIDWLLAIEAYNNDLGPHGQLLSESTNPLADPNNYSPYGWRYVARGPFTDWAQKARLDAEEQYRAALGEDDKNAMHGKFWAVERLDITDMTN